MRKRNVGIAAGCLLTTIVLGVGTASAQNTKTDKLSVNIPSAGIAVALENYNVESNKKAELSALITDKVAVAEETTKATGDNYTGDNYRGSYTGRDNYRGS